VKLYHLNTGAWGIEECTSRISACAHGSADNHYTSLSAAKLALVSSGPSSVRELDLQVIWSHCKAGVFEPNPDLAVDYDRCKPGTVLLRSINGRKEWIVKLASGDWRAIEADKIGAAKASSIPYSTLAFTAGSIAVTSAVELSAVFTRPYGLSDAELASVALVAAEAIYTVEAAGASNYPAHWEKIREDMRVQYITFARFFVEEIFRSRDFGGTEYIFPHETIYTTWATLFPTSQSVSYREASKSFKLVFFEAYTAGLEAIVDWSFS